jgi:ABC-type multidrug transport system ATPase subunit
MANQCPRCGNPNLRPGANNCSKCGQLLASPQSATLQTQILSQLVNAQSPVVTFGRDPSNNVPIPDPIVSRFHAKLTKVGQGHVLEDLNSQIGTLVNGQPLRGGRQSLQVGARVQIGRFKFVYDPQSLGILLSQPTPNNNSYGLEGHKLIRKVPDKKNSVWDKLLGRGESKTILNQVSLSIEPGKFVALVGGSGAGKSTLLKAFCGIEPINSGRVLLNGDDLYAEFNAYRHILGYVPQKDILHQQLTVISALQYAARLRLPADTDPVEITRRIKEVLRQVKMDGEHETKTIGDLSGGQIKRVSIAVELLSEPGLFFLDEPTSGLDPYLEQELMELMRKFAHQENRTIILVTHATASITKCDHVAFMAHGYLAFFGTPQEAQRFFGKTDFAEIYGCIVEDLDPVKNPVPRQHQPIYDQLKQKYPKVSAGQLWAKIFANSLRQAPAQVSPPGRSHPKRPISRSNQIEQGIRQFGILCQRYTELIRQDTLSLFVLLAVMPIIGCLLLIIANSYDLTGKAKDVIAADLQTEIACHKGEKTGQDCEENDWKNENDEKSDSDQFQATYQIVSSAQKLLFMLALAVTLLGIFASANEIEKEESIYLREHMINLQVIPYVLSKLIVLASFALWQCFSLLAVIWFFNIKYPSEGIWLPPTVEMFITLFLATVASISLGLLISARFKGNIYLILLVLIMQILFAGAIFDLPSAAEYISYGTITRWTLEALGDTVNMPALNKQTLTCVEFEDKNLRDMLLQKDKQGGQDGQDEDKAECDEGQMKQASSYEFNVSYEYTQEHLRWRWLILVGFTTAFTTATMIVQKRKDTI